MARFKNKKKSAAPFSKGMRLQYYDQRVKVVQCHGSTVNVWSDREGKSFSVHVSLLSKIE